MSSYFLFLILGLGAGATYAILGQGLVLKYRSAGVVDFAHGAVAMFIAYVFINLRSFGELELPVVLIPHQISLNGGAGISTTPAIVISLVYAAIFGLVLYVLIYRPIRSASLASITSPSRISSRARLSPTIRGSRTVAPISGSNPYLVSSSPTFVSSAKTRKSHASASCSPAP